jgi:hypothetical protein
MTLFKTGLHRTLVLRQMSIFNSVTVLQFHPILVYVVLLSPPKRDEVTGDWRRLHKKELYAVYNSPNIIRVIK